MLAEWRPCLPGRPHANLAKRGRLIGAVSILSALLAPGKGGRASSWGAQIVSPATVCARSACGLAGWLAGCLPGCLPGCLHARRRQTPPACTLARASAASAASVALAALAASTSAPTGRHMPARTARFRAPGGPSRFRLAPRDPS